MATIFSPDIARQDTSLSGAARRVARAAAEGAALIDHEGAYPVQEMRLLHEAGLLVAPLPPKLGGRGLGSDAALARELCTVLRILGAGNLAVGRLYEGHVNAIRLMTAYGSPQLLQRVADEVRAGRPSGVWNSDDANGLHLRPSGDGFVLQGRKILASGAGHVGRPIVTAFDPEGRSLMVAPDLPAGERADLSQWTSQGMRASATGAVDFTGLPVRACEIVGKDADYLRQPDFSGGAWRFAAVQQGGMEALLDGLIAHLRHTKRGGDPHQQARVGQAVVAVETARLWVERACVVAEVEPADDAGRIIAFVNFARSAVERAALDVLELVQRSIGLTAFMRPHPMERIARDLATYLRQPGPDRALTEGAAWVLAQRRPLLDDPQAL